MFSKRPPSRVAVNQEERKQMQKNKNRRGLALGAVFSLVASLVVMAAPAQASETSVVITPRTGTVAQTSILADELFDINFRFGTGVNNAIADAETGANSKDFGLVITKPAGVTVSAGVVNAGAGQVSTTTTSNTAEIAGTSFDTTFASSTSPYIQVGLTARTSVSAAVTITVTPYIDMDGDGEYTAGDAQGTAMDVTFVPWSAMGATVAIESPLAGDRGATASFSVTQGTINWSQLDGVFNISVSHTADQAATGSANITYALLTAASGASASNTAQGNYSASYTTHTSVYTTSAPVPSLSASIWYEGQIVVETAAVAPTALGVSAVTISPVTGDNAVQTGDGTADARVNAAFVLNAYPYSASITTSVAIASAFTVSSLANIEFDADSGVILNGTTYTSSAAFAAAGFTLAAGTTTVPVSTFGQSGTGTLGFDLTSQLKTDTVTITVKGTEQVPKVVATQVAGLAGVAKTFAVTANDQWDVASVRTDQRIAASVVLGGSTSTTVSSALVNGATSITVTPTPAARTGSAVVTFTLQTLNQSTQEWENTATRDTVTWNVYSYAAGTDAFTSRTVSVSGTISYGVALSWSDTVTIGVLNSFSDVAISAPGLMIQNVDDTTQTASDTLTVAANGQAVNAKFTSRLAGTYTVTFTTGAATTTSEVVIAAAAHDSGATLTFDVNSLVAGETTTITGTLLDINGNPVMTSGSSNVSVAYTGKGLPFNNSTTMETDADGQLTFQVLVLSSEKGDAAIAATYKPAGLTVDTDNISVVHALAVGTVAAADAKVNAGSFKGYVAVYARGYEGQRLSAKIGKDWVIVDPIVNNQENGTLFRVTDFTGAGVDIAVRIYIDRVLIDTINLTTK